MKSSLFLAPPLATTFRDLLFDRIVTLAINRRPLRASAPRSSGSISMIRITIRPVFESLRGGALNSGVYASRGLPAFLNRGSFPSRACSRIECGGTNQRLFAFMACNQNQPGLMVA
jgi:hypothetical protein